ncbi:tetratricopeptide repeat protein [Sulfitobacter sp. CW3]|uniref:tetratricopeptide repeat protein n=1 Tax=Sulfitobacter sp. CW3 TaxID=2861965 RepID=UPI002150F1D8|nr:tetratricopeptide repeat protein [Sulfitobacter sp. CW3]
MKLKTFDEHNFSIDSAPVSQPRLTRGNKSGHTARGAAHIPNFLPNAPDTVHASCMAEQNQIRAKLFLIGPLELTDAAGTSFTPRSKKACALLALLALAPRGQRTRVWLRDKLWSESCERKSAISLRQIIFEQRRDLGPNFDAILEVDRHSIKLKREALWIDYHAVIEDSSELMKLSLSPESDLLEGMDIQDEEFEDWLQLERQNWRNISGDLFDRAQKAPAVVKPTGAGGHQKPAALPLPEARISFGVLPNIQQGCDESTSHIADHLLEGIIKNLRELHLVDVYDLRDAAGPSEGLIGASNTDYFIRVRTLQIRQSLTLTFFLYTAANMSLEWSQSIQTSVEEALDWGNYVLSGFVTQNADRVSRNIERKSANDTPPGGEPPIVGYTALNMMFRLDPKALQNAEHLLSRGSVGQSEALFGALRTYAASFKVGENLGALDNDVFAETDKLVRGALIDNPFNAVSLACLGHVVGYVFHDHVLARDLLERALRLNQNQAFVWDHYALNRLYAGDYETAQKAAERAVYLGSYSPIGYSYETTLAMTSTMLGKHQKAIQASRNALSKQPKFTAAMRYLLVNLAQTGRDEEAAIVYQDLLVRDPNFSDTEVQKARFRISQADKETNLIEAIKRFTG